MCILSVQSHVAYGYVGNKAAVYPLQNMGYDVVPINTVQFSNHTGYGSWKGEIFTAEHIKNLAEGLVSLGIPKKTKGILSGYMGSREICEQVYDIVKSWKKINPEIQYLCDPVIGNTQCFVKPEVLDFFKNNLSADIITPNQFEAETLTDIKIENEDGARKAADYFHNKGIKIVIITGNKFSGQEGLHVFLSTATDTLTITTKEYEFEISPNGTGDVFSALFLGSYLKSKSAAKSLDFTVNKMDELLRKTKESGERELAIVRMDYKE
jgi:pyridoxine kinase